MNTIVRIIMICLAGLWFSAPAMAKGADKAKKAFESGDYSKAYKAANKAAKKASGSEKAELLVIAGASAAKLGKSSAKSKFKKALKLDPNVSLPSSVADDKKVKKAFAAAQKSAGVSTASSGGGGGSSDNIKATKSKSAVDTSAGNFANYLPFGINNFMQGKTVVGAVTFSGQALGLLLFINRRQAASDADADAKEVIASAEATNQTEDPEFLAFIDDNEAFVTKARSEANLSLFMFVGAYALSVVDALFDPFGMNKTAALDAKKDTLMAQSQDWRFNLNVLPAGSESSFLLDMKRNF